MTIASLLVDVLAEMPAAVPALGPGDDDPRSPVKVVGPLQTRGPLAPGEPDGDNPDDAFHFLTPPAPGPGDPQQCARSVVRVPKTPPIAAITSSNEEQE